jgi:hypothetical protein
VSARERVLAALEGAPEVRPGTAEQLVADLVAEVLHETPLYLAEYDSVESEVHLTLDDARDFCDDIAKTVGYGQCWDWSRNEDGVYVQFWTHADDDRPLHLTGGTVTEVRVQRSAGEQGKGTREGELTPARRSSMRLAAFLAGAHNGRAMMGGAALTVTAPECDDCGSGPAACGHCPTCDVCLDCHECSIGDGCKCRCSMGGAS